MLMHLKNNKNKRDMIKTATTKDYRDLILEQLNLLENITCKPMMGEYLIYYKILHN